MTPDKCAALHCRAGPMLYLKGVPLCEKHYADHCDGRRVQLTANRILEPLEKPGVKA